MKKSIFSGAILAVALLSSNCMAQDVAVGLTGGTMGLGLEGTTNITDNINIRGVVAGFKYSQNGNSGTDVTYKMDAQLLNAGFMLDYYPFETVLRLSAGAIYNGTKVTMDGQPNAGSTYTFNNNTYTAAQVGTVSGEAKYQKVMPYLGIGFANPMKGSHFTFGLDIGAMIGKATASLSATNPANNATLASDVAAEQVKLQNDVDKLTVYPVLQVSLSYRF